MNSRLIWMTCLNKACRLFQKRDGHNMRRYGCYKTNMGKRRRLQCRRCKRTRGTNTGTAYAGLRCSRNRFDLVAKLSVEGVDISAISRIVQVTWNTAARWQERAAAFASDFLDAKLKRVELQELQADEIRTTLDGKHEETWVFTTLCVWSRLWLSKRIGRRSYKNTKAVLNELFDRVCLKKPVLITTDGFDFYARAIKKLFGAACVYAQVIKTLRNNRVHSVDPRLLLGSHDQLETALDESEDSTNVNTSFVERLNLTIRRGCSSLHRKTPSHARGPSRLTFQVRLFQCYYNFGRPHSSLRFGTVTRTPAMQAGLTSRKVTFRNMFLRADTRINTQ
jgi:transposase-like protein/IS1 family transposase